MWLHLGHWILGVLCLLQCKKQLLLSPRKRALAFEGEGDDSIMEALAGRSQSTKLAVNSALLTMPANFVVFSATVFD